MGRSGINTELGSGSKSGQKTTDAVGSQSPQSPSFPSQNTKTACEAEPEVVWIEESKDDNDAEPLRKRPSPTEESKANDQDDLFKELEKR